MAFLNALFSAALDQNIVFGQLVGMVIVFLAAERPQDAFRLGGALWVATFAAGLIGWPLYTYVLAPWGIDYMASVVYVLVSAAVIFALGAAVAAPRAKAERSRIYQLCALLAVNAAVEGVTDKMVAFKCTREGGYTCETSLEPLDIVANFEKKVPREWINEAGNGVKQEFIDYVLPLIQGETDAPKENGLPRFAHLKKVLTTEM